MDLAWDFLWSVSNVTKTDWILVSAAPPYFILWAITVDSSELLLTIIHYYFPIVFLLYSLSN